ncbi:MAG TPA: 1-deoxy-D-xylulose-5-phosphate reductoisomerase [Clostridiaceae bacterium]|jgi:1-deoxy-D-xylulose-5-phosphate reductoisomerase|nr:1-deoxy-D-xylulose-5-phosphate reductoisomerase [Clostridiaceae bacterium]
MAKKVTILGSTGSIGVQTLDVARNLNIKVIALSANSNIDLLVSQAIEFKPFYVAIGRQELEKDLREKLKGLDINVLSGMEGILKIASLKEADTVVNAIVGIAGLLPTLEAIRSKKDIAIANKETLVTAGALVTREAREHGVRLLPIDSEHSAIMQCLAGTNRDEVERIILTASGGPFRGKSMSELKDVSPEDALKHPNWNMGPKITIDSATLMNKGLEVIEARWLFGIPFDKIKVVIHPQSIIHSMVEYVDGSYMAQLGAPDMRTPIQLALTWPEREKSSFRKLDLIKAGTLTFEEPDYDVFPCLKLAFDAAQRGGTMPVVLNAANEEAVALFLRKKIGFYDIPGIIKKVMEKHDVLDAEVLENIEKSDKWARNEVPGIK